MAMYPNATNGYMPFVKPAHKRQAAKKTKCDKSSKSKLRSNDMKTYKVMLRDRNGFTYTYIIQADPTSNSMPNLIDQSVKPPTTRVLVSSSMPNMNAKSPTASPETSRRHALLAQGKDDLSKVGDGEKKGLFNSIINFIKKKTGGSKSSSKNSSLAAKSKRKAKPVGPKKRQRTISTTPSNLDTIHESPHEDDFEGEDTDSYTHDSDSDSDNDGSES